jgi:hypothetical protein
MPEPSGAQTWLSGPAQLVRLQAVLVRFARCITTRGSKAVEG